MKVSILLLTIDRFEITRDTFLKNMHNCSKTSDNFQVEILVADNGSQDKRTIDFFKGRAHHRRLNSKNEGIGHALNQLYIRSTGDIICCMGNDLEMPQDWISEALPFLRAANFGIFGYDWGHGHTPPNTHQHGRFAGWLTPQLNRVFGSWIFNRRLVEQLGFFHEGYGPYGIEDSDFNERVNRSGFYSCYHPTLKSKHMVNDVGQSSDYRKMKDESLGKNVGIFGERLKAWDAGATLIEPLPDKREPL